MAATSRTALRAVTTASAAAPGGTAAGTSRRSAAPLLRHRRGDLASPSAAVALAPATASVDQEAARELVAWLTVEKGAENLGNLVSFGDGAAATLGTSGYRRFLGSA